MKAEVRERAVNMRLVDKMGYGAIAKELKVSKSTLSRWLADLPLSEERILELRRNAWSKGEAKRERFRETMRQKREMKDREMYVVQKKKLSRISRQAEFVAGLMLYAAEGDKKTRAEIAFTNTDPVMVAFFSTWLERFLAVPREKLRIQLHLYEDMDIPVEERFWMSKLHMTKSQLCKSQVRLLRPKSFSYKGSIRHGTCKLYVGGVVKKSELMLSIKAFFDTYNEHSQV